MITLFSSNYIFGSCLPHNNLIKKAHLLVPYHLHSSPYNKRTCPKHQHHKPSPVPTLAEIPHPGTDHCLAKTPPPLDLQVSTDTDTRDNNSTANHGPLYKYIHRYPEEASTCRELNCTLLSWKKTKAVPIF